jgi:DNA-binding transcriptional ArsR family regulator
MNARQIPASLAVPELDDDQTVQLAEMFRLMGDPTRLRIILSCLAAPTAVGTIATSLGLSTSLVSHHLRLLRAARVLRGQRRGKQVFYAAADEHITCVIADMLEHVVEPGGMEES